MKVNLNPFDDPEEDIDEENLPEDFPEVNKDIWGNENEEDDGDFGEESDDDF